TGFVGREVVERLMQEGHVVRVISRGTRPPSAGPEWVRGSVLDARSLPAAFRDCHAVVHLVGIIGEIGEQTFERVHVEGTRNVIAACHAAGVSRLMHMSALGSRPGARSRYHQSKWAAEESVRDGGLRWTIFRPSLIYGRGDGFVTLFARFARWSPVLPVLGPGTQRFQPVAVGEVARCFAAAPGIPESVGCTVDVCGPERLTMNAILESLLAATGRNRPLLHLPWGIAGLQAGLLEAVVPRLLGKASPLNRDQVLMLQEDNVGDPGPATRLFGLEPVSFAEGIRRFLIPGP
ncbi:MAG: complex I NDUFA9 subunit family protein, partial [Verrucomicrobia bacterium]|nr:complex I NDUFA9 subunit family protein [Verrucomicrobiota bacterium]